jgi:hypothetical protein
MNTLFGFLSHGPGLPCFKERAGIISRCSAKTHEYFREVVDLGIGGMFQVGCFS